MPTIKFKLKDPKYCNGCYCLQDDFTLFGCKILSKVNSKLKKEYGLIDRPQSCIDKFGE